MKVLLVITGLSVGGAERQVLDIAYGLKSKGHEVKVAYFLGTQKIKSGNLEVFCLGQGKKNILAFICGSILLVKLINTMKPDIVHAHMFHAIVISRLSRFFTRIRKLVCTSHSSFDGGKTRMLIYRITSFLGDVFTNVSEKAVNNLEARGAAKKGTMIAILNGINIDNFKYSDYKRATVRNGLADDKQLLLSVGRFHKAKDYPNLLYAFSLLTTTRDDVELWIVGDGPLKQDIESLIHELNLDKKVKLLGVRNDIPDLMNAADVYVLSSAWEGFGLVVAEAMATERIVVATDCGGVKEVLGDSGFLVPVSDPTLLANSINTAISLDKFSRLELGKKARQRVMNNYSIELVTDKWIAIYNGMHK